MSVKATSKLDSRPVDRKYTKSVSLDFRVRHWVAVRWYSLDECMVHMCHGRSEAAAMKAAKQFVYITLAYDELDIDYEYMGRSIT